MKQQGFTHDTGTNNKALSIDWYTPKWIFDSLNIEFDLDPCAPTGGVPWIPAKNWIDIRQNGLNKEWFGNVWLNPPYGKDTKPFLKKMHHYRNGIALVFARTDCIWYHEYAAKADAILFLKGRIKFVDGLGISATNGCGSGSMLIAWGNNNVEAIKFMAGKGDFFDKRLF